VSVLQEYKNLKKSLVQKSTFAVGNYRRIVIFLIDGTLALNLGNLYRNLIATKMKAKRPLSARKRTLG
jgi:hypothetical protein